MYYGKHYYAYFYSEKYDTWFQFDDATIRWIGNFKDVIERCIKGKAIPRIMFYERIDILQQILTENREGSEHKAWLYFADSNMQNNNFGKNRKPVIVENDSTC